MKLARMVRTKIENRFSRVHDNYKFVHVFILSKIYIFRVLNENIVEVDQFQRPFILVGIQLRKLPEL